MRSETHFRRQLVTVMAVFLGATVLLMGLAPQEAQSQEKTEHGQQKTAQVDGQWDYQLLHRGI